MATSCKVWSSQLKFIVLAGLLLFIVGLNYIDASKILVVPFSFGRSSRFMNMVRLTKILAENGNEVIFLTHDRCLPAAKESVGNANMVVYNVRKDFPLPAEDMDTMLRILNGSMWTGNNMTAHSLEICESLLARKDIMEYLKDEMFDILFVDYATICNRILVDYIDTATIVWSNFGMSIDDDLFFPILPSVIPGPVAGPLSSGGYSSEMNFWQRLKNFADYMVYNHLLIPYIGLQSLDELKSKYQLNTSLYVKDAYIRAKPLVICNSDFWFDYPRPLMPHVIPISGLFLRPIEPLSHDLEKFMQSSNESGVIVVSFGSLVTRFGEHTSHLIAKVLSKFPQKVVWRFSAPYKVPLGDNTKTFSWLPQNDILGHSKTRLFITHCGISGSYEAIQNGVPVIGIPLLGDQWHNCRKLTDRAGMGASINLLDLTEQNLEEAIQNILNNQTYKDNAVRLSNRIKDQLVDPKEKLLYWFKQVAKYKGVDHLHNDAFYSLKWYEYIMLDVIGFILFAMLLSFTTTCLTCYYCCKCICKRSVRKLKQN